ncbi:MAG: helix-turn-helix transcriptional regulator [bacterium]|nr:MAG: helix-turn-helix transcriptional regulator [bacterium]
MGTLLDTRQLAQYLGINEKQVYTLISDRGLPGTKVTGKWLFPRHLVDRWVEAHVANMPPESPFLDRAEGLLLIAGSDDPLLVRTVGLYRNRYPEIIPLQSRAGSGEGLLALKRGICHIACVHLMNPGSEDYNSSHLAETFAQDVVAVAFAHRTQGLVTAPGNPLGLRNLGDAIAGKVRWAGREEGTGTRLLFDREMDRLGLDPSTLADRIVAAGSHMEVGLAVLRGEAEAGMAIEAVSALLGLGFVPVREERFDLVIRKANFFRRPVQDLLGLLRTEEFGNMADTLAGYDVSLAGKVMYP